MVERALPSCCRIGVGWKRAIHKKAPVTSTNAITENFARRLCSVARIPKIISETMIRSNRNRPGRAASRSGVMMNTSTTREIVTKVSPRSPDQNWLISKCKWLRYSEEAAMWVPPSCGELFRRELERVRAKIPFIHDAIGAWRLKEMVSGTGGHKKGAIGWGNCPWRFSIKGEKFLRLKKVEISDQ